MIWKRAPLYVDCHDLARWLHERLLDTAADALLVRIASDASDLLASIVCALSFPEDRMASLHTADRLVVRLRVLVRLAVELGSLRPNAQRFLTAQLDRIGRQIGGWRRHAGEPPRSRPRTADSSTASPTSGVAP
jgi:hypothetical protein